MNIFMIYLLHILSQIISLYVPKKATACTTYLNSKKNQTAISQQVSWVWSWYFAPFLHQTWITTDTNIGQNRSVLIFFTLKNWQKLAIFHEYIIILWIEITSIYHSFRLARIYSEYIVPTLCILYTSYYLATNANW